MCCTLIGRDQVFVMFSLCEKLLDALFLCVFPNYANKILLMYVEYFNLSPHEPEVAIILTFVF